MAIDVPLHLTEHNIGQDPKAPLESYSYDDRVVRLFAAATIFWGIVAFLIGIFVSLQLIIPQFGNNFEWLAIGRMRPLHTNAALFAFVGNAIFAAVYYTTQRLCKARMWSSVLAYAHFLGWQLVILGAVVTLPRGITQGRMLSELEWPLDVLLAVVWVLFFGVNFFMTLATRRQRHMYISLWFYIATIITVGFLHVFNNIAVPVFNKAELFRSYPIYAGVQDAFMQWWYGHNLMAFLLIMPFLGMMYYFLPKAAGRPIYSYKLSIVHFWSLVFLTIWAGPHHLHYTSLPEWASSLGMLFAFLLWMPSWGGMINGWLTLRGSEHGGSWKQIGSDPVLSFFGLALVFYGVTAFESAVLGMKSVAALTQFTDYEIAHIHAIALGWTSLMTFGMIYWLAPRIFQTKLYSIKLASFHFWISLVGILLYVVPIYLAGMLQAWQWNALDENGQLVYPDFLKILQSVLPMYWCRVVGGSLYLIGLLICSFNFAMTWSSRPTKYSQPTVTASRFTRDYLDPPQTESELTTVLEFARTLDTWSHLDWHCRLERKPFRFTAWVILAVVVASAFEMVPIFFIRANVPMIAKVKPYTPLELAGREVYIKEGCYSCHSQTVRPLLADTKRYGGYSQGGEFVYDSPVQWGSRRVGPDLAREGGRQSNYWHYRHMFNPRDMTPGSIMPAFPELLESNLDFKAIRDRVRAAMLLGARYDFELDDAEAVARQQALEVTATLVQQGGPVMVQDKTIIALIAYLQRLGTDLTRADTPALSEPANASPK